MPHEMRCSQLRSGLFPSHASHALSTISRGSVASLAALAPADDTVPAGLHHGIPTVPWNNWLLDLNGTSALLSTQLDHYVAAAKLNAKDVEARMHALWNSLSSLGVSSFPTFNMDNQRFLPPRCYLPHCFVSIIRIQFRIPSIQLPPGTFSNI